MQDFVSELHTKVAAAAAGGKSAIGIVPLLRKDKTATDVYDLLFGLSFLEPRYSLLFQETQIEQLSPGQRGALLLIFYLLVDKGRNPIILDQPEENLDNETVVSPKCIRIVCTPSPSQFTGVQFSGTDRTMAPTTADVTPTAAVTPTGWMTVEYSKAAGPQT